MPKAGHIKANEIGKDYEQESNCVRVTYHDILQGYFPNQETAIYYMKARETARGLSLTWEHVLIEPWFIEGEF